MRTWFTADTHFGHENIIKLCKRPFKTLEKMDAVLTKNWNARVKKNDTVIFIGDFCYKTADGLKAKDYIEKLNGYPVFIRGNHDQNNTMDTRIISLVLEIADKEVFCVHSPEDFSSAYSLNLVGHVHQTFKVRRIYNTHLVNVGVDVWRYHPVEITEILKAIKEHGKLHPYKGSRK